MREQQQRDALLNRIRAYVDERGIVHVTLDTLASALNMPLTELQGYFQKEEDVIVALIARDRVRQREAVARIESDMSMGRLERSRAVWHVFFDGWTDACLLFESYALGIRDPHYRAFVHGVDDWVSVSQETLIRDGFLADEAQALATLSLAVRRGAMMDFCATRDRERVNAAMELWFELLYLPDPPQ